MCVIWSTSANFISVINAVVFHNIARTFDWVTVQTSKVDDYVLPSDGITGRTLQYI